MERRTFSEGLTRPAERALWKLGSWISFPTDHALLFQGQPVHSVFLIDEGYVKVGMKSEDGTIALLSVQGNGEVVGLEAALSGQESHLTVRTGREVVAKQIEAAAFGRYIEEYNLGPHLVRFMLGRLRESDAARSNLMRGSVQQRVSRLLLDLADKVGFLDEEGWVVIENLLQAELGSLIGASRDAVAGTLAELRRKGLIATGRRAITLLDQDSLRSNV
ncbi:Crp/Fnr family transcriptional regulator [Streptomyces sp. NBC_01187]|uniref:Crp/Fnr family transcriptional regulator n=1 Tax=Streptomyces sp. NBC_01187 TaxID=2903766 RepID=UPI00386BCB4E|nr:Crp/Fnr family transcriptional regulator [Streptomyces sp. NBC_01187]